MKQQLLIFTRDVTKVYHFWCPGFMIPMPFLTTVEVFTEHSSQSISPYYYTPEVPSNILNICQNAIVANFSKLQVYSIFSSTPLTVFEF